ncbi:hypothetical protein BEH_15200 [Priestia filamentosa]|uniref:Uncharacterized protein n=1 Tax=Priestia filamentosa TaxID=1402861 RepID=A0A0H4KKE6_9BACI|nr:hypothetical protein BEH_15200 [Priestia filamentosa]
MVLKWILFLFIAFPKKAKLSHQNVLKKDFTKKIVDTNPLLYAMNFLFIQLMIESNFPKLETMKALPLFHAYGS